MIGVKLVGAIGVNIHSYIFINISNQVPEVIYFGAFCTVSLIV